jgi:hypothetical protein
LYVLPRLFAQELRTYSLSLTLGSTTVTFSYLGLSILKVLFGFVTEASSL